MTFGPIYFNGVEKKGPLQSGNPVAIDKWDYRICCCTNKPLFLFYISTSFTFCVAWWFDSRNAQWLYTRYDYRMFRDDTNDIVDSEWWDAAVERGVYGDSVVTDTREEPGSTNVEFGRRLAARITLDESGKFAMKIGGVVTTDPDYEDITYQGHVIFLHAVMLSYTGEQVNSGYSSGSGVINEDGTRFDFSGTLERSGVPANTVNDYLFRLSWVPS